MSSERPRDAEPAREANDQDSNWAAKAQTAFKLLPLKKAATAEEQAAWQRYFAVRSKAEADWEAAVEDRCEDCAPADCAPHFKNNVLKLLRSFENLTKKERNLLGNCVQVHSAGASWALRDDVRNFGATARIYSVDGNSAVDVHHTYHNRNGYTIEHIAEVAAVIRSPADEPVVVPYQYQCREMGYSMLWDVWPAETGTRESIYAEDRHFHLTEATVHSFREALFTGPQGTKIGDKLDDYDLMLLLLTPVGVDEAGLGLPCGMNIEHCCDGWEGVQPRRLCDAADTEDEEWEETDFGAHIAHHQELDREDEWW